MERLTSLARTFVLRPARRTPTLLSLSLPVLAMLVLGYDFAPLLSRIGGILTTAIGLGMVIFLHELGHFAVAKWCDVKVERFSIGFGPAVFAKTYGETEYALCWLPLGGYVKMLGQDDADASQMADETIRDDPRSYTAKSVPARMAVISAGVIMNIITGTLFFAIAYGMGVKEPTPQVGSVSVDSPAWQNNIEVGDRIIEINGVEVSAFTDIIRGTALSKGDLEVMAQSASGDLYSFKTPPDTTGRRRTLGIGPMPSLDVGTTPDLPAGYAGTAAEGVDFRPGDRITAVDGVEVADYVAFLRELAKKKADTVDLTLTNDDGNRVVELPPEPVRALGFRVDIGEVKTVTAGSVGANEGIRAGDRIAKVDGEAVGVALDPLDLPEYFADKAGEPVTLTINRKEDGNLVDIDLSVTPRKSQPWLYESATPGASLAIPSLGVTASLIPTVLDVAADSIADEAGLKVRDSLVSLKFVADPNVPDGLSGEERVYNLKEVGWPFAAYLVQLLPSRTIELTVDDSETGTQKIVTLPPAAGDSFVVSERGIRLFNDANDVQAGSPATAIAMGTRKTVESSQDIYLTLQRLFGGQLSPLELAGPISIAKMGYRVATNNFADFLMFLGFLSVNLAVVNFLPIPVLDGGHMVFLIWEAIMRKPPSERIIMGASILGLCLVLGLMLFVVTLDILKSLSIVS